MTATMTVREHYLLNLLYQAIGVIDALSENAIVMPTSLATLERSAIIQALDAAGDQVAAARLLGISPRVIDYKMKAHGIARRRDLRVTA